MDPTKNRGMSKIFTCFKPVTVVDDDVLALPVTPSENGGRRKKKVRRSFSVASMKAVFCKPSSLRKSKSESSKQDLDRPSNNFLSKSKKLVKSVKKSLSWEPHQQIFRTNSNHSSLFSSNSSRHRTSSSISSSSISSLSSNSGLEYSDGIKRSVSLDFRQMSPINGTLQKSTRRDCGRKCIVDYYNPSLDQMCIFLVCLVALVFWGKVFAIVTCTSTWLFVSPGQRFQRVDSSVNDIIVVDSEEYKKW